MLDVNLIRNNPDLVKKGVASKNVDPKLVDDFLSLDERWRKLVKDGDDLRSIQKKLSEERKIDEAKEVKEKIKANEEELKEVETEREKILYLLPNLPIENVRTGKDESENEVLRKWGEATDFEFPAKDHLELGETLGVIDIKAAGEVSGSRFSYLKGKLAQMEFAIIQFVINALSDNEIISEIIAKNGLNVSTKNFVPVIPPVLIRKEMMQAMGYMERGEEEIYYFPKDDLTLVGTAEQSIGPMHAGEVFNVKDLPLRYLGFSTCFRREAGSYGKDTRGILRSHQFDKLEMFSITTAENSIEEHKFLLAVEEYLMQELKIPYQVIDICSGDLGDPAAAKFDIEAWMPGQPSISSGQESEDRGRYRETHSVSNTTDFQARRLNIRYKDQNGEMKFVHMLNGTAFAIGRTLVAIMENYQQEDGSIKVPEVLQKYLNFDTIS
ncbi:MAG: serine--tRNA ligase [Candidatus Wolfebacteria bacterium]|nr:serine--tRNA ligase [Candidatus Wolfebacteria bacterium]